MGDALQDRYMQQFVAAETQKQRFQELIHTITDQCWELCMANVTPSTRLDRKTESCITNCVDRFIDTSNFVVNRLEKEGEMIEAASQPKFSGDSGSFSTPSSPASDYASSGFKWN